MTYKEIIVVLDSEPRAGERISIAAALAERFSARLVGLYIAVNLELPGRFGYFNIDAPLLRPVYRDMEALLQAQGEKTRALFEEITGRRSVSAEWRQASGHPAELAAIHGRYADLIVLGQLDPDETLASLTRPRPEEVAMLAGRPILVVPYAGAFSETGKRVLVGWDASREATRAVNDAMPLLAGASSVTVMTIDAAESFSGHGEAPGADIALHLARHGVTASVERNVSAGIGVGNALLSRASDIGADLLVMGVYGHSRVRELMLGGVTRTILGTMTVPVLMSH